MLFFYRRIGRCATLLALGGGMALYSQGTQTAGATVTVVDQAGAPVAGAGIIMRSPALMGERTGVTNAQGVFIARLLPPGTYSIEVIGEGLQTARISRRIGMDQHFQPRITMQKVSGASVEVLASAMTAVDPTDVKTASNYGAARIDTLPTGRGIDAIAALTPGVTQTWSVGGRLQVRGAMTSGNLFLVDGQNLHDNVYNNLQYPIVTDSIDEVQVITGAISAEYGGVDGGVINTVTKSGGNRFEGEVRVNLSNPAWDAVRPHQNRAGVSNVLGEDWNYSLSGFFLKDKLWFAVSYMESAAYSTGFISAAAPNLPDGVGAGVRDAWLTTYGGPGASFTNKRTDERLQAKLTYMVSRDHTLVLTYNKSETADTHRNFNFADLRALTPVSNDYDFYNFSWRAVWSPIFTTEVRFGAKNQTYVQGQTGITDHRGPIHNYGRMSSSQTGLFHNVGVYNGDDGGDRRSNRTANVKGSYFLAAAGTHQFDFGLDWYDGFRKALNEQSPANFTGVSDPGWPGMEAGRRYNVMYGVVAVRYNTLGEIEAMPADVWFSSGTHGRAGAETYGLYLNDKWKINEHVSVQVGLRWDRYDSEADDVGAIAGADGFSPRLGVSYDPFGDQKWIFKASFCRYNSAVLEKLVTATSGIGSQKRVQYAYRGGYWDSANPFVGYVSLNDVYNLDNYKGTSISSWSDPTIDVGINPNMKAPHADEFQISATYSLITENLGRGYVTATYVDKTWGNLIDYRRGYNGTVNPYRAGVVPDPSLDREMWITYWDNEPDAKRDYEALELSAAYQVGNWNISGNITWSTLKGNYEGEGSLTPGAGQGLHKVDVNGYSVSDPDRAHTLTWRDVYPYGYLQGHTPTVIRAQADYTHDGRLGKTVFGFAYRRDSGNHYNISRTVDAIHLDDRFVSGTPDANSFGSTWSQFYGNLRRTEAFNSQAYHDASITHDFDLFSVSDYRVRAFVKLVIYNVFNHQQLISWDVSHVAATAALGVNSPWVRGANYGRTDSPNYWGTPRSYTLAAGLRF